MGWVKQTVKNAKVLSTQLGATPGMNPNPTPEDLRFEVRPSALGAGKRKIASGSGNGQPHCRALGDAALGDGRCVRLAQGPQGAQRGARQGPLRLRPRLHPLGERRDQRDWGSARQHGEGRGQAQPDHHRACASGGRPVRGLESAVAQRKPLLPTIADSTLTSSPIPKDPLSDYARIVGAVRVALQKRDEMRVRLGVAQSELALKEAALARVRFVPGKESKVAPAESDVEQAKQAVEQAERVFEEVTTRVIAEVDRYAPP
eukprot:scaffold384_cov238-Pinguiococcus_pyrenoidosus.AAC.14